MLTIVNLYSSSMKCLDACSFIIYCIFGFEGSSDLEPVSSVKTISVAFLWKAVSDELGNMWIYGPCRLILGRSKSSLRYYSHSEATDNTLHFQAHVSMTVSYQTGWESTPVETKNKNMVSMRIENALMSP